MARRSWFGIWTGAAACGLIVVIGMAVGAAEATAGGQDAKKTVWDGVYTEEQAKRGRDTYQQECAACHLDDLLGDGIAPPLVGSAFSFRWSDLTVGDMFEAIRTTMPQGAPASLSPQTYIDIISWLLKANEIPAGTTELPAESEKLQQILITEKKAQ